MVINAKKFRTEKYFDKLLSNALKYSNELKFFDLDLLNITCNNVCSAELKYCVLQSIYYQDYRLAQEYSYLKLVYSDDEIESARKSPVIIHYAGKPGKPWRLKKTPSAYDNCLKTIPKSLRRYTFRDWRKRLFSKV